MSRRFVVMVEEGSSIEDIDLITDLFDEMDVDWWHWILNVWLIIDDYDQYTSTSIRELIHDEIPRIRIVVLSVKATGFAAKSSIKSNTWLKNEWMAPD